MKNETDSIDAVDLDKILTMVWDFLSEIPEKPKLNFMKVHDDEIMTKIKDYSVEINSKNFAGLNEKKIEEIVEQDCSELFDSITQVNFDFCKQGARMGARLIAELIFRRRSRVNTEIVS